MENLPTPSPYDPRRALSHDEEFLFHTLRGGCVFVAEQLERLADMAARDVITGAEHLHLKRAIEWGL